MGDELRSILRRTDGTAPGIQASAGIMMRFYDKSATVAVTEWRNALQNARKDQLLPLLYVANEVLQISKRNRGNNFLEAFSPILGQGLQFMCQSDSSVTEKVRRTVKIWGDRRVFSLRFVNELLKGLEPFRYGNAAPSSKNEPLAAPFSPTHGEEDGADSSSHTSQKENQPSLKDDNDDDDDDDDDDSSMEDMVGDPSQDSLGFMRSDETEELHLDLNLTIDATSLGQKTSGRFSGKDSTRNKRKRGGASSSASDKAAIQRRQQQKRRRSMLSTTSLMELWNQTLSLQQAFDQSLAILSANVTPQHLSVDQESIQDLVGDELLENYKKCLKAESTLVAQRRTLHSIASERRGLEQECVRFIPWLRLSQKQDDEDLKLCDGLEKKLLSIQMIHADAKSARDVRREQEAEIKRKRKEQEKIRKEEEERRRLIEEATKRETEAKPGMVWNRATREYQYPNTDESWRD